MKRLTLKVNIKRLTLFNVIGRYLTLLYQTVLAQYDSTGHFSSNLCILHPTHVATMAGEPELVPHSL